MNLKKNKNMKNYFTRYEVGIFASAALRFRTGVLDCL